MYTCCTYYGMLKQLSKLSLFVKHCQFYSTVHQIWYSCKKKMIKLVIMLCTKPKMHESIEGNIEKQWRHGTSQNLKASAPGDHAM